MEQNLIDIYDLVEHAIDNAFEGQMNLKFYDYLKDSKIKKHEVDAFIDSTTATKSVISQKNLKNTSKVVQTMITNNCVRVMGISLNLKQERSKIICMAS